jgi:hypothetical protein
MAAQWWISSSRREAIQIAAGALVLTVLLVAISLRVETEQESLRAMLYETADHLQNNRKSQVAAAIYSTPSAPVVSARDYLNEGLYTFETASIKKIHSIDLSGPKSSRRALVKMNVFVEGTFNGYTVKVPQYVEVTLYRVNHQWLVYDFTHDQPFTGFKIDP